MGRPERRAQRAWAAVAAVVLTFGGLARGLAAPALPPAPSRWFTDQVGFVSPQTAAALDAQLQQFERTTGYQVVVYIAATTGGVPVEEWAARTFESWGIGHKGKDDGLALFILSDDRKARVEVGYALEERVTDAQASRILDARLIPGIRAGQRDEAVRSTVMTLLAAIEGKPVPELGAAGQPPPVPIRLTGGQVLLLGIIALGFLFLLITHPSLALFLLFQMGGRGSRGGWGGGGGFSGGGGRSGGGGATGSW